MKSRSNWSLIALIVIGAFVVSCAAPPPTPVPTTAPSPTALVKATTAPATPTAIPAAATTAPSVTPQPATATLPPTATSQPTTTAVPTSLSPVRSTTATVAPTAAATSVSSSGTQSNKVDMNAILPPGKGQTLLLNNCTSCHSFVCAIKGQRTVDYWQTIKTGHRERVSSMSDDDFNALFSYLAENFNDKKPVPELPPALQDLGCSAQ